MTTDEPVVPPAGDGGLVRVQAADDGRPARATDAARTRIRLDVAYDGTDFHGWARQHGGQRTVQQVLEEALATVLRLPQPPSLTVAGRTDAGVHARGQVAHADVLPGALAAVPGRSTLAPTDALVRRLAGVLPPDVRVRAATLAPPGFDARFSPLWRRYAYRLDDAEGGVDPLRRYDVLWARGTGTELDVDAMDASAAPLVGHHDFAAYCRRRDGATTVRTLLDLRVARRPAGAPDAGLVVVDVRADAFCHSMVRALVGALLAVGEGRRGATWPAEVLAGAVRDPSVHVAPARGLTLEEVAYPDAAGLAARAEQTRRRRDAVTRTGADA